MLIVWLLSFIFLEIFNFCKIFKYFFEFLKKKGLFLILYINIKIKSIFVCFVLFVFIMVLILKSI